MAIEREVLEFIIVPPFAKREAVVASKERMENYLGNRFRGYKFRVAGFAPVGDDESFTVVPIMNFCGDDGKSYMCEPPKSWFMSDIAEACREFDRGGLKTWAA